MVYLDANATEPLRPEARAAMLAALDGVGNPSSIHRYGRSIRRTVEDARESLAARFGGRPADLVFVSGGTEADALAIHALGRDRRVIIGATEHDAVRSAALSGSRPDPAILPVDGNGIADLDALRAMLRTGGPALVCLMLANNETGTIQPIREAAVLCREYGALLHVDAVQAAGRLGTGPTTAPPLPLREGVGGRGSHPTDRAAITPPPAPPSRGGESIWKTTPAPTDTANPGRAAAPATDPPPPSPSPPSSATPSPSPPTRSVAPWAWAPSSSPPN